MKALLFTAAILATLAVAGGQLRQFHKAAQHLPTVLVDSADSDSCSLFNGLCDGCTKQSGCGFCTTTGKCESGSLFGPKHASECAYKDWHWISKHCPLPNDCSYFSGYGCEACTKYSPSNLNCGYCVLTGNCTAGTTSGPNNQNCPAGNWHAPGASQTCPTGPAIITQSVCPGEACTTGCVTKSFNTGACLNTEGKNGPVSGVAVNCNSTTAIYSYYTDLQCDGSVYDTAYFALDQCVKNSAGSGYLKHQCTTVADHLH